MANRRFDIAFDKSKERIQHLVDCSPKASKYYSDAYPAYSEICYEGSHLSLKNKSQTYTVEGVNSDFRHYIPALRRRSKCFFALLKLSNLYSKFSFSPLINLLLLNFISNFI